MPHKLPSQPVHIEGETILHQAGEEEHYRFSAVGQLVQLGTTVYLRFNEDNEEAVPVTYKIDGSNSLRISRRGESQLTLQLIAGQRTQNVDVTPYGKLQIAAEATAVETEFDLAELRGTVSADYRIFTDDEEVGNHQIRLQFYR
ncbi:DUF1934 domain-containing protein [Fructilactobacillus cliffordii]|uniref:DUF1934 domain-containing protein n=1 Tax=Fructilactobacillus cliffordii TaxID=2940299 RepID=UPI0020927E8C|nr:DUF1934 domain-containing protein [Fructilactobacillus cliffordii]USS87050.1 DUF1934 domain-containing protein [Fructilactobacillus cliffordii]